MTSIEINRELLAIKEDVKAKRIASIEVYYTLKFWAKCDNLNFTRLFQCYFLNQSY